MYRAYLFAHAFCRSGFAKRQTYLVSLTAILSIFVPANADPPGFAQSRFPVIDGFIDNHPVRCLISTTTPVSAIDIRSISDPEIKLKYRRLISDSSTTDDAILISDVEVRVGDAAVRVPSFGAGDLSRYRAMAFQEFDVVLGNDFLKHVVLNFSPEKVWISKDFEQPDEDFDMVPLKFEHGFPILDVRLRALGVRGFAISTTSDCELQLTKPTSDRLVELGSAAHCRESVSDTSAGSAPELLVTCANVTIGSCRFENVPAYVTESNTIGMDLLRRIRVSVDFVRNIIYISKKSLGRADWFPRNDSGTKFVFRDTSSLQVVDVTSGSAGDQAGLKVGDEVLLIGEKVPKDLELGSLRCFLCQSESPVRIVFMRDGKRYETELKIPKTYEYPPKWDKSLEEKAREFFEQQK
ncbi:MAG: PDZ domain-containing protein [Planctomyces sp.]|nr:PDZ domain-containing protein [Planctomyces sp.]